MSATLPEWATAHQHSHLYRSLKVALTRLSSSLNRDRWEQVKGHLLCFLLNCCQLGRFLEDLCHEANTFVHSRNRLDRRNPRGVGSGARIDPWRPLEPRSTTCDRLGTLWRGGRNDRSNLDFGAQIAY